MNYPAGMHVTAVTLSLPFGWYPAQTIFIFGAAIAALIPSVIYSLTYLVTQSKVLSGIAFFSTYFINPSGNLEQWIMGYFYNGPYPNLIAFLIVFVFVALSVLYYQNIIHGSLRYLVICFVFFASLILTYPAFAPYILLFTLFVLVIKRKAFFSDLEKEVSAKNRARFEVIVCILLITLICVSVFYQLNLSLALMGVVAQTGSSYLMSFASFVTNALGIMAIAGAISAIILVFFKRHSVISFIYIGVFTLLILSLLPLASSYLSFILPKRTLVLIGVLSWPLMLVVIDEFLKARISPLKITIQVSKSVNLFPKFSHYFLKKQNFGKLVVAAICFVLLFPSFYGFVSSEENRNYGWLSLSDTFNADFAALKWIDKNVPVNDLVLNDLSFVSQYSLSLSPKNLTYQRWFHSMYLNPTTNSRALELFQIWQNPTDIDLVCTLLLKYNVSYVLSTSEWYYWRDHELFGGGIYDSTPPKPASPAMCAQVFDSYPFLVKTFEMNSTRVYKVLPSNYKLETQTLNGIWGSNGSWGNGTIGYPNLSYESNNLTLQIPSGNFSQWGLDFMLKKDSQNISSANYLRLSIFAQNTYGLSIFLIDNNSDIYRYDIVTTSSGWQNVDLCIDTPIRQNGILNKINVTKITIATGWIGPFPGVNDMLSFGQIQTLEIQNIK